MSRVHRSLKIFLNQFHTQNGEQEFRLMRYDF